MPNLKTTFANLDKKWAAGIFAAIVAAFVILPESHSDASHSEAGGHALPARTITVKLEDGYLARRSFTGRALPGQLSPLSFELSGQIREVLVDIGHVVKAGDALVRLDSARLEAQEREVAASLAEAEAEAALAEKTLKRTRQTFKQGHVSAQHLDEAEARASALRARVARLAASRDRIRVDIAKSTITAPYDGAITARMFDEGSVVAAGAPVLEISQEASMEAHIGLTPFYARAVQDGAEIRLLDINRKLIEGAALRSVVPTIAGETRTMLATFDLPDGRIIRGELITALVDDWQAASGAWLPLRALSADVRGLWRVHKVTEGENGPIVRFENVQILYTDRERVYVTGTLSDGDRIIADGVSRLAPGQRITPLAGDRALSR